MENTRNPFRLILISTLTLLGFNVMYVSADTNALFAAAHKNDIERIRQELEAGTPLEARTDNGYTPLALAVSNGQIEAVRFFIDRGANLETRQGQGYTPVMLAARKGYKVILELLVEKGADLNARADNGFTALMLLCDGTGDSETVKLLLELGANPDLADQKGTTALMRAARFSRTDLVELLLAKGANWKQTDADGKSAWSWAYYYGAAEVIESFRKISGAPPFPVPGKDVAAFASAYKEGLHIHIFWFELGQKAQTGLLPGHTYPIGVPYPSQNIHSVTPLRKEQTIKTIHNFFGTPAYRLTLNKTIEVNDNYPLFLGFAAEVSLFEGLKWTLPGREIPLDREKIPPEVKAYTKATPRYDINHPAIKTVAAEILKNQPGWLETIRRVWQFVNEKITYDSVKRPNTASMVLEWGKGRCGEFTRLTIALLRACGIPARGVWGLGAHPWLSDSDHAWTECWIPGYGWLPVQSQYKLPPDHTYYVSYHQYYLMTRYSEDGELEENWEMPSLSLARGLTKGGSPNGVGVFVELPVQDRRRYLELVKKTMTATPRTAGDILAQVNSFPPDSRPFLLWLLTASRDEDTGKSAARSLVSASRYQPAAEYATVSDTERETKALKKLEQMMAESPSLICRRIQEALADYTGGAKYGHQ